MVKGMWYDPQLRAFGCSGHSKCFKKCLYGKGSADERSPNCGAFNPPDWAEWFVCPRFIYRREPDGRWVCIQDKLGLIAPLHARLPKHIRQLI